MLVVVVTSALRRARTRMTSACPWCAATQTGVWPPFIGVLTHAPSSASTLTVSAWPKHAPVGGSDRSEKVGRARPRHERAWSWWRLHVHSSPLTDPDGRGAGVLRLVNVASGCGQGLDHLDVAYPRADQHGGGAVCHPRVHVRPALEEEPRDTVAPEPDRERQRRHGACRVAGRESVVVLDGRRAVDRHALRQHALERRDVAGADCGAEQHLW